MKVQLRGEEVLFGTGSGHPEKGARTVVFIHGAGFDHAVWVMPARFFARHGFRVLAPDLPAHGGSGGAPLTSINDMADWLAEFVQLTCADEDLSAVSLVGHSMGSLVAMTFAERYPDMTDRLALLGVSSPMPVGKVLLDAAQDNHHAAIDMANSWSHSRFGHMAPGQAPGLSNLNSDERWLERMDDGVYHTDLAACNAHSAGINVGDKPVLLILGGADRMTPVKVGQRVAQSIAHVQTVILPDCGHAMLNEQPNQVLDALAEFVMAEDLTK